MTTRTLAVLAVLLMPASVLAQTADAASSAGLFGSRRPNPRQRQSLEIMTTLTGTSADAGAPGADADLVQGAPAQSRFALVDMNTAIRYARGRGTAWLQISAGSAIRYRSQSTGLTSIDQQLSATIRAPLWRHASLSFVPTASHTPFFQFTVVPAAPVDDTDAGGTTAPPTLEPSAPLETPSSDFAVSRHSAYSVGGGLTFAQTFGARDTLTVTAERSRVYSADHTRDLFTEREAFRFSHRLSRDLGVHALLGRRLGQYDTEWLRTTDIDIGLDFSRPLSISRRTRLTFTSGSALTPEKGKTYYNATGEAALIRDIGRTWKASVKYSRSLQYLDSFPRPFFGDGAVASVSGLATRRLRLGFSAGSSRGQVGLGDSASPFRSDVVSNRVNYALTRHCAVTAEYVYYFYRYESLPDNSLFPARMNRHTARVGVTLWLPVMS